MDTIKLTDICRPKQWKTISTNLFKKEGYPVYGANGKIGFFNSYTHERPTVLITCRGATCGTINICEPQSYVNGNAMALDKLDVNYSLKFLYYVLKARGLNDVISGSAQPQITRTNLSKVLIPNPPLKTQQKIASVLDKADRLVQLNRQLLEKYDQLAQSLFWEMFGDPVSNVLNWKTTPVENVCLQIMGGGTPSKSHDEFYTGNIPWVTPKDMKVLYIKNSRDKITEDAIAMSSAKLIPSNSILMVIRSGILKKKLPVAINTREVTLNQDMKAFIPDQNQINPQFFLYFFLMSQRYLLSKVRAVTADNIEFKQIKELPVPLPRKELQEKFADSIKNIEEQKALAKQSFQKSQDLFQSLLQKAFKGELIKEEELNVLNEV